MTYTEWLEAMVGGDADELYQEYLNWMYAWEQMQATAVYIEEVSYEDYGKEDLG